MESRKVDGQKNRKKNIYRYIYVCITIFLWTQTAFFLCRSAVSLTKEKDCRAKHQHSLPIIIRVLLIVYPEGVCVPCSAIRQSWHWGYPFLDCIKQAVPVKPTSMSIIKCQMYIPFVHCEQACFCIGNVIICHIWANANSYPWEVNMRMYIASSLTHLFTHLHE